MRPTVTLTREVPTVKEEAIEAQFPLYVKGHAKEQYDTGMVYGLRIARYMPVGERTYAIAEIILPGGEGQDGRFWSTAALYLPDEMILRHIDDPEKLATEEEFLAAADKLAEQHAAFTAMLTAARSGRSGER